MKKNKLVLSLVFGVIGISTLIIILFLTGVLEKKKDIQVDVEVENEAKEAVEESSEDVEPENTQTVRIDKNNIIMVEIKDDGSNNMTSGPGGFYFLTDNDPLEYSEQWDVRYSSVRNAMNGGVYIDGKLTTVGIVKIASGRYYVALSDHGKTASKGTKIVVEGTFYSGDCLVGLRKATFEYDGNIWKMDTSTQHVNKKKVSVDIKNDRGNNIDAGIKGFYFLTSSDPLKYNDDWSVRYGATQTLNGGIYVDGKLTNTSIIKISANRYYVALNDAGIQGVSGMQVVIDATVFDDEHIVTFKKAKFICDGDMWQYDSTAEHTSKNKITVKINNDSNGNATSGNKGFYFLTTNDPLSFNTDWSVRYGGTQTIYGGIYIDGVLKNVSMIKIASGRYYVALSDHGFIATAGMTVTIDTTVFDENNVVTFGKTKFVYDGSTWEMAGVY